MLNSLNDLIHKLIEEIEIPEDSTTSLTTDEMENEAEEAAGQEAEEGAALDPEMATDIELAKAKTETKVPWISLYLKIEKLGWNSDALLKGDNVETNPQISKDIATAIMNFRTLHHKVLKETLLTFKPPINIDDLVSGEELQKQIQISLIRCKYYFWFIFGAYQTALKVQSHGNNSDKTVFGNFPKGRLYRIMINPSNRELGPLHYIVNTLPQDIKKILLGKNDLLKSFITRNIKTEESIIYKSLSFLEATNFSKLTADRELAAQAANKHTQKAEPQEITKSIMPSSAATYEADTTSTTEDPTNQLMIRYMRILVYYYTRATKETLINIDELIYKASSNPYKIEEILSARVSKALASTQRNLGVSNLSLAEIELNKDEQHSLENQNNKNAEEEERDRGEIPQTEEEKLIQQNIEDKRLQKKEKQEIDQIVYGSNNFLKDFFSTINYASCVGYLLEQWAKTPEDFDMTFFDKSEGKLITTNIINYLYKIPSVYLLTGQTSITELQVYVLSCVEHILSVDGQVMEISPQIIESVEQELTNIFYKYNVSNFLFNNINTSNREKEAARKAYNIETVSAYSLPRQIEIEKGTFKEKLISYINTLTANRYFNDVGISKEEAIEKINACKTPLEIENLAKKYIPANIVGLILSGSTNEESYKAAKAAPEAQKTIELINNAKTLTKSLNAFADTAQDLTKEFTINGNIIKEKDMPEYITSLDLVSFDNMIETLFQSSKGQKLKPAARTAMSKTIMAFRELLSKKDITEAVEFNKPKSPDLILQETVIYNFTIAFMPILTKIATILHKLGLFLLDLAKEPTIYLKLQYPENFKENLKYMLSYTAIEKIMEVFDTIKDQPIEESDPLNNPVFKNAYIQMKDWLLVNFKLPEDQKQLISAFKNIDLYENDRELTDWEPLKDFLRRKMPEILAKLQIKQGGHSGKGKILKAIEGLLRKRFVSTTPSTLRKSSEEEKVNRERNEELRKELATSVAARKLFAGFGKNRTPKPAEELKPQE